jgi:hypothetical protein
MTERRTDPSLQDLNRGLLIAAAVALAVASTAALAGFSMLSAVLIAAARRWYRRADLTPRQLANLKWQQARAAANAGSGAWSDVEKTTYSPRAGQLVR